ncbi:rod shape-determining protein [Mediterraneibacter butyricigenes]|uniref:Cell shape-determining protein MreB n=1 Tax=Mediterraneibacter butyricigenes TaxID=2316025 RepID=A0A391NWU0_9FIRM|nr:rod shape-determining protein [Mediterraneibacter butyricigenes]GCA65594.1 rod shape-determining protein [Mediterraneibacter butyricigenes]
MARNVYGLDLGTYEIKVYDKKNEKIWKEKDVIAVQNRKYVFAVGDEAYEMYEKAPSNIQVVFPMQNGVISHFEDMQYLLTNLLNPERKFMRGSEYVIAVPTDVTEVEKKAFFDLVSYSTARAREVKIVERGIADAVGLGLNIFEEKGILIANFGGGTTDISILSSGGMVLNKLVKIGGEYLDNAVANLVRHNRDFLIGRLTAEALRKEFGVFDQEAHATMQVAGRNLITGVPQLTEIPIGLVRAALREPLKECVRAILSMLDRTPPDVRKVIEKRGMYLTGGLANLRGLDIYLQEMTGLRVRKAPRPELCAVEGLKKIIWNKELKTLTYSMLDEDYRWLR